MPYRLDEIDVDMIKSLQKDGRKSFRQISREIGVSTPTVKLHYQRLVDMGLIKSVSVIFDLNKISAESKKLIESCNCHVKQNNAKISKDTLVKLVCEFCDSSIEGSPRIMKLADSERYFCCNSCKSLYRTKYKGRIDAIERAAKK